MGKDEDTWQVNKSQTTKGSESPAKKFGFYLSAYRSQPSNDFK